MSGIISSGWFCWKHFTARPITICAGWRCWTNKKGAVTGAFSYLEACPGFLPPHGEAIGGGRCALAGLPAWRTDGGYLKAKRLGHLDHRQLGQLLHHGVRHLAIDFDQGDCVLTR